MFMRGMWVLAIGQGQSADRAMVRCKLQAPKDHAYLGNDCDVFSLANTTFSAVSGQRNSTVVSRPSGVITVITTEQRLGCEKGPNSPWLKHEGRCAECMKRCKLPGPHTMKIGCL